jgi:hypothetical protein
MILSSQELAELTGKTRPGWQARELDFLHIPYRRRSDGSLIVYRCDAYPVQDKPPVREPQVRLS